jgi:hypothetical protein
VTATGAVSTGAVPTGAVPTGAVPTGAVPTGAVSNGSASTGSVSNGTASTGAGTAVTYSVDPWDPGYGVAFGEEMDGEPLPGSSAELVLDLELPADRWRPLAPEPGLQVPDTVLFLDGVRRIDARVWVHGPDPQPAPAIAASYAAGLVCLTGGTAGGPPGRALNGSARIADVVVERGLFTSADATGIDTRYASYPAWKAPGPGLDKLSLGLQQRLASAEEQLALVFRKEHRAVLAPETDRGSPASDLLFVDGPLRGRTHLDRTIGYIKTHHASYLPPAQAAVVSSLQPGQRTPAFTMGTSWRRNSWYLRLPGSSAAPWSSVVRLECSADLPVPDVIRLADCSAALLSPLASSPHKDPRAPQNLVPIGGLERELRRRLGDQRLLYRSLRAAASAGR